MSPSSSTDKQQGRAEIDHGQTRPPSALARIIASPFVFIARGLGAIPTSSGQPSIQGQVKDFDPTEATTTRWGTPTIKLPLMPFSKETVNELLSNLHVLTDRSPVAAMSVFDLFSLHSGPSAEDARVRLANLLRQIHPSEASAELTKYAQFAASNEQGSASAWLTDIEELWLVFAHTKLQPHVQIKLLHHLQTELEQLVAKLIAIKSHGRLAAAQFMLADVYMRLELRYQAYEQLQQAANLIPDVVKDEKLRRSMRELSKMVDTAMSALDCTAGTHTAAPDKVGSPS